jgi:hypothetical protein
LTSIVVTTIFEPTFLNGYLDALREGRLSETTNIIIIPDRKTPASVSRAAMTAKQEGFRVLCPTLDEQETFLRRLGVPKDFIPYDTDNRRNVGFLMALEQGCDVLISIDDDNYCPPGVCFVEDHRIVGSTASDPVVHTSDGWFNICSLLKGEEHSTGGRGAVSTTQQEEAGAIFPRGFPYFAQRANRRTELMDGGTQIPIAMNAGLWLDDPDVDAVYRLCRRPKIMEFKGSSVILGPDVWSPINSQNTAMTRAAALTYYYVRMGFPLQGLQIDRYGDILSGYLTQKCVKHLGQGIRIGTPILDHRRSPHNLFKDLYHELAGMVIIEELIPWLMEVKLSGSTHLEAYTCLAEQLAAEAGRFKGFVWDSGGRDFLSATARCMKVWIKAVVSIG